MDSHLVHLRVLSVLIFLGLCFRLSVDARSITQTDKKHEALNHYVAFTNECIHLMGDVSKRLEQLNMDAVRYLSSDGADPLKFRIHDMVQDYQFKSNLQAPCSWMEGSSEPIVNIQHLYEATKAPSENIPLGHRISLNTTRNRMLYLMIEFLQICDTLETYAVKGQYRSEPELRTAFWAMKNCERIYQDFRKVALTLHDQVNAVADAPPTELLEMRDMIAHSQEIMRGVRYENPALVQWQILQLQSLIHRIESDPSQTKKKLQAVGLDNRNSKSGYENMIVHARSIIRMAQEYLYTPEMDPQYASYGKGYYYFNHLLLDVYNHHKYGMLAYYNRFLSFSTSPMVKMIEEPPLFRVIYKVEDHPDTVVALLPESGPTVSLALYAQQRASKLAEKPITPAKTETPASAPATTTPSPTQALAASSAMVDVLNGKKQENASSGNNEVPIKEVKSPPAPAPEFKPDYSLGVDVPTATMALSKAATNHLIFLVDVSSSMNKPEKLPLLQETLYYLVQMMRPEDHITLIAYSGKAAIVLEATSAVREDYILRKLSTLNTGGRTNMGRGLKMAYQLAQKYYVPGGNNRVILASDGMVRMNRRNRSLVKRMAWEDISLSTFHLAKGSSPSVQANLEKLARLGAGNYHLVNEQTARSAILIEATAVMKH